MVYSVFIKSEPPHMIISQKVLGASFLTHTVYLGLDPLVLLVVEDTDTVILLTSTLRSLLFSGNTSDRIETLTQRVAWSQFAADYFSCNLI